MVSMSVPLRILLISRGLCFLAAVLKNQSYGRDEGTHRNLFIRKVSCFLAGVLKN